MKQATVRQLRNNYAEVLRWAAQGDEVQVTRRGRVVARVLPPLASHAPCDWSASAAFRRAGWKRRLTAAQSAALLADAKGGS